MSEPDKNANSGFSRFSSFAGNLRSQAQELSQKAAAQVNELNSKVTNAAPPNASPPNASPNAAAAVAAAPSLAQLKSDNVSKEQLLEILQKLNKKVKLLNTAREQLTLRVEQSEVEKQQLLTLVTEEILGGAAPISDNGDVVPQLQAAWRAQDEQNALNLQTLQSEFQRLQRQQQQQQPQSHVKRDADSNDDAKVKQLEEQHAQELVQLKESLHQQHAQELEKVRAESSLLSTPTPDGAAFNESSDEVQRIKEAAAQQLQVFKRKVAKARTDELEKVRRELGEQAEANLQSALAEQAEQHVAQMAQLQSELHAQHLAELEQVRMDSSSASSSNAAAAQVQVQNELEAQHAATIETLQQDGAAKQAEEVARVRAEVEQTVTSDMEERLQEVVGDLQRRHKTELDQARQQQQELVQRLEALRAENQDAAAATARQDAAARTVEDLQKSHVAELERVRAEFAEEKRTLAAESEQAARTARDEVRSLLEADLKTRLDELTKWFESDKAFSLEALQDELTGKFEAAVAAAKNEAAVQLAAERTSFQTRADELQAKMAATEKQLKDAQKSDEAVSQQLQDTLHQLDVALADKEAALSSANNGRRAQSELDGALTRQKWDYEEAIVELRTANSRHVDELQQKLDESIAAAQKYESELTTLRRRQEEATSSTDAADKDAHETIDVLRHKLDLQRTNAEQSEMESRERAASLQSELENAAKELERAQRLSETLEENVADLQEKLLVQEREHGEFLSILRSQYDEKLVEMQRRLDETISGQRDAEAKVIALQQQLSDSLSQNATASAEAEAEVAKLQAALDEKVRELKADREARSQQFEREKDDMRNKMAEHVDQMKAKFREKMSGVEEEAKTDVSRLEATVADREQKATTLLEKLKALSSLATLLKAEKAQLVDKLSATADERKRLEAALSEARRALEEASSSSSATATSLLEQQESLEREKREAEARLKKVQSERDSLSNRLEETSGKLTALSENLNHVASERREQDEKLQDLERQVRRLRASEAEMTDLREQVNNLKLELTKSANAVSRLREQKEANERDHGQRTQVVGLLENQVAELTDKNTDMSAKLETALYDLSHRDETIQEGHEQIQQLQREIEEAKAASKRAQDNLTAVQKGADSKNSKAIEALQKEVHVTKQQMARKSTAAQKLIQEREAECAQLRESNNLLQQEVEKGSLSDRRIFELAAKQSNRESHQASEIDIRDKLIERMKEALLDRDGQVASFEKHIYDVESQVEELCRVRRREDINLDYLKSIVVQFLSMPPASSERARLLPVLATLLQFNAADYKTIEDGKNKMSWWGSVAPTFISAPASPGPDPTPVPSSAEVSISSANSASSRENGKPTSLQF